MADPAVPLALDDLVLAARCRDGEEAAARELFRREAPRVQAVLYRILGGNRDVEDLLQETFVAAFATLGSYRGEARLGTWLARIAVRLAIKHLRRERRGGPRVALEVVGDRVVDGVTPDRVARAREGMRALYRALDGISPVMRVVFVMHEIEGVALKEVAAQTGATLTATKVRLWRARRKLEELARGDAALAEVMEGRG